MRTFEKKPKAPQQATPAKAAIPGPVHSGQSHDVNSILQLQRTIGNQAVQRLIRGNTLQQGGSTNGPLQRDVIDVAREKLSYGLFDWAITDSEAMGVLALLGTIDPAKLSAELGRLGEKYVTRLLDNLPDGAKSGDIYKRVIQALGPAGLTPYVDDLLSYGVLDWAITDAEVTRVFNSFINLAAAEQEKFLVKLNTDRKLGRLIDNSNATHHASYIRPWMATLAQGAATQQQRDVLKVIVENSDNLETTILATKIRFSVDVGRTNIPGETPADWDLEHLKTTYLTLDLLPEAHVANNEKLLRLGQMTADEKNNQIVAGVYAASELAINKKASGEYRGTILHETGHSVDKAIRWSISAEPAKPERGGWKNYGANFKDCATDMVEDSAGGIKALDAAKKQNVIEKIADAMMNQSVATLAADIKGLPWFGTLKDDEKRAILDDKAIKAIDGGLLAKSPWFNAKDGGEHLGDHVYQEGYALDWSRYKHEARSRMLTPYQFRDIGEWFAECYAAYYFPDSRGKGAKLNDKDPNTKKYFDDVVDKFAPTR